MTTSPTPANFADTLTSVPFDSWDAIQPIVDELSSRPIHTPNDFIRWLQDRSDVDAACSQARANLYITMTRHTDDADASAAWSSYLENVQPPLQLASFELDRKQRDLAVQIPLDPDRYEVLNRDTAVDVELFREVNVPIETELGKLDQEYDRITGAMTVQFEGAERTMPQMSVYLETTDRSIRESAWRTSTDRRLADREKIDDLYDQMIQKRDVLAHNADFPNFRDYAFRQHKRFDYTPADCVAFHDACREHVVPLMRRLDQERQASLNLKTLRPWDLAVDVKGRSPLSPFKDADDLVAKTQRVFDRMGAGLGDLFRTLSQGDCLDLESRKGKAPGGYQYMRDWSRTPFIFMNAAGLHSDVRTLVHEAGHAFHSLLCRDEPLVHYRHSPIEFAEVASMSMELLTMDFWDEYYPDPSDLNRARREQLEGVISILPWVATIDAFQHWIYLNPKHSQGARTEAWIDISSRFGHDVSWEDLDAARDARWQRQGHLFGVPFYYIEYAIAQLGALQLWLLKNEHGLPASLDAYKKALTLGGSRPLGELFAAADLSFDFGETTVQRLTNELADAIEKLPA